MSATTSNESTELKADKPTSAAGNFIKPTFEANGLRDRLLQSSDSSLLVSHRRTKLKPKPIYLMARDGSRQQVVVYKDSDLGVSSMYQTIPSELVDRV